MDPFNLQKKFLWALLRRRRTTRMIIMAVNIHGGDMTLLLLIPVTIAIVKVYSHMDDIME